MSEWVRLEERACTAEDVVVETAGRMLSVRLNAATVLAVAARDAGLPLDPESVRSLAGWLREVQARIRSVPLGACPFEGDVEVVTEPNGHVWWVCPLCDTEYHDALTKEEMRGD